MLLLLITLIFLQKGDAGGHSLDRFLRFNYWQLLPKGRANWLFCQMAPSVIDAVTEFHNKIRENVTKRLLSKETFGNIPGSKTLFKLKYDCTHEQLARGIIGNNCKHSSIYMDKIGKGESFIRYKLDRKPSTYKQKELFEWALEDWVDTVRRPLGSDVMYTDMSMEPFANMIYNKTLKFGCSFSFCNEASWVALACVYDNRPKKGEPLYWADSKNGVGCQKSGPCKKVVSGAEVNCDTLSGLCDQDPPTPRDHDLLKCNKLTEDVIKAVTDLHNELRAKVSKRLLSTDIFGNMPGSKTLFKLRYDCRDEGLAQATIGSKCKHSSIYMDKVGRGENFITYRLTKKPNAAKQKELFANAVEDWMMTVEEPLSSDVVYTYTSMEPFANMIYNKTLNFGCSFLFCNETRKVALACVYDKRPKKGEPLYWADSKNNLGCQKPGPCKKVIKGTDVNCDTTSGLCDQDPPAPVNRQLWTKKQKEMLRKEEKIQTMI